MARVTVAIVTYRSTAELPSCLDSLLASDEAVKIVVIDNASGDGTLELARTYASAHDNVMVIDSGGNIGLAAANNLVLPHIEGDYVLILNPDTVVRTDTISALISAIERNGKVGVVGPKSLYEDGRPHTSYHYGWNFGHLILWRVFPYSLMRRLYDRFARYRESEVYYVSGACMLVRADVFREIQGYDPAYFLTAEDTCDVCRRVRQRGYTIQFTPTAIVTHLTGRSGEQVPFLATLEAYKGSIYYFGKYNGALGRRFAYAIIVLGSLTRMGTSLIKLVVRRKPVDKPNLKIQYSVFRRLISNGSKIAYSSER